MLGSPLASTLWASTKAVVGSYTYRVIPSGASTVATKPFAPPRHRHGVQN